MTKIAVGGIFDDLRSRDVCLLEEASKLGDVQVLLWSDALVRSLEGRSPKFSEEERHYLLQANRYVNRVTLASGQNEVDVASQFMEPQTDLFLANEAGASDQILAYCQNHGIAYRIMENETLKIPSAQQFEKLDDLSDSKKVLVTGCYDWFHSGHVRFFEEVSELGDLYVVVGHDANVRLLKGDGHPMFSQDERRYMVQAIRYVTQALISSGHGWMDSEPEIDRIKPDIYAVNEDGDKAEKREFCAEHGIDYVVLKRLPKEGLPKRESTALRGF